jgi:hypothetical protein
MEEETGEIPCLKESIRWLNMTDLNVRLNKVCV